MSSLITHKLLLDNNYQQQQKLWKLGGINNIWIPCHFNSFVLYEIGWFIRQSLQNEQLAYLDEFVSVENETNVGNACKRNLLGWIESKSFECNFPNNFHAHFTLFAVRIEQSIHENYTDYGFSNDLYVSVARETTSQTGCYHSHCYHCQRLFHLLCRSSLSSKTLKWTLQS